MTPVLEIPIQIGVVGILKTMDIDSHISKGVAGRIGIVAGVAINKMDISNKNLITKDTNMIIEGTITTRIEILVVEIMIDMILKKMVDIKKIVILQEEIKLKIFLKMIYLLSMLTLYLKKILKTVLLRFNRKVNLINTLTKIGVSIRKII